MLQKTLVKMTIEPVGFVTLLVGILGLSLRPSFIVYAFFASTLLGAAAAFILTSLGDATIQPAHVLLGFLTIRLLMDRDVRSHLVGTINVGSPGFWLLLTVIYSTVTAYAMPRLFQGQTLAFAARAQGMNYMAPLVPTTTNITQSVYFIGDGVTFLVLLAFGSTDGGRKCLGRAALMCVIVNLIFAGLDLVTYSTNTSELLSPIRNSTYSIMSDSEEAGFKRIVGSFVEASSFGYWTLGYFAFSISLWLNGRLVRMTFALSLLSFLALLFSTSTTAYVGLFAFLLVQFFLVAVRFCFARITREMTAFLFLAPFALCVAVVGITINDASSAYFSDLLNTFVLNKMSTSSGIERSSWNSQAIQNFFDTFGFGAGNGSVRASSFPIAVLSSLGIYGAASYAMFLLSIWLKWQSAAPPEFQATRIAARSACLAWLLAASVSASFIDLGLPFFAFAALGSVQILEQDRRALAVRSTRYRDLKTTV